MEEGKNSPLQVLKFAGRPKEGAFFFSCPREILISYEAKEIPGLLERLDRARQTGLHVAGFLAYEALHGILGLPENPKLFFKREANQKQDESKRPSPGKNPAKPWPLLAFGLFSEYKFIPQKNIFDFLNYLASRFFVERPHSLSKRQAAEDWSHGDSMEDSMRDSLGQSGFRLSAILPKDLSFASPFQSDLADRKNPFSLDRNLYARHGHFYTLEERQALSRFLAAQEGKKKKSFFQALSAIQRELCEGNSYQINYTQKSHFHFLGNPLSLFAYLYRLQPSQEAGLCLWENKVLLSLSPENFLEIEQLPSEPTAETNANPQKPEALYRISTRPMKGTAARSVLAEEDARNLQNLSLDAKSRAENLMIVDLLRNDLGRVAKIGSVSVPRLFEKESHPSLHQMTSRIEALLDGTNYRSFFSKVLPALFPSGSITGAPKLSSMQIIGRLEHERRGAYTGSLGYALSLKADAQNEAGLEQKLVNFNVLIRSFEIDLQKKQASYGAGCGIVYDSKAEEEWQEYLLKKAFFAPALSHFHLIETMQVTNGKVPLLDLHLKRLEEGLHYFRLLGKGQVSAFLAFLPELLLSFIEEYIFAVNPEKNKEGYFAKTFVLKKSQGNSGKKSTSVAQKKGLCKKALSLRYSLRLCLSRGGEIFLAMRPLPEKDRALRLCLSPKGIYSKSPFRRHKTSLRGLYDSALAEARLQGFDDVLFLNEREEVAESAVANLLFLDNKGVWVSPGVESGALAGVFLRHLSRRHKICFRPVRLPELLQSPRIYLSNAIFGLRRVAQIAIK